MQENDIIELKIENFSNLGYGVSRKDNFVIFVEGAVCEDVVEAKLTKVHKNYANAKTIKVVSPSKHRVTPFCPMQNVCGACQLQFIDYDYQLELKQKIVQDTLSKIGKINNLEIPRPISSPQTKEYRHKIQYPISQTKNSKRILAGYFKPNSHEIVNIKYCPIQPEICDKIIDFIRENAPKYNIEGYYEPKHNGLLRHVVIRSSYHTKENLVVLVINSDKITQNLADFAQKIYEQFEEVSGVCVNFNDKKTNVILGQKSQCLIGKETIQEKIIDKTFEIGANTFFQVNPQSAENIFKYVKNYIQNNFKSPTLLDAYAGIGAFGIVLSDVCKNTVCVEENKESCTLAQKSVELNAINKITIKCEDANKFFNETQNKFDIVILDPPRKGCTINSLDNILRICSDTIIYVSCNPASLARDLKYLTEKGVKLISIQPFDMFCHTYHIENVAILKCK